MGIKSGMTAKIAEKVKKDYPYSKNDLYAVFIEKNLRFVKFNGFVSMITQHSWMFQSSYLRLRDMILNNCLCNLVHLGAHAFDEIGGEVVQTCSFVINKRYCPMFTGNYVRVVGGENECDKKKLFFSTQNHFTADTEQFKQIEKHIISYWLGESYYKLFKLKTVGDYGVTFQGIITGKTEEYLRMWFEPLFKKVHFHEEQPSILKTINAYFPYNKGGYI